MTTYSPAELNLPPLMSVKQFAARIGRGPDFVYRLTRASEPVNGWPPIPTKRGPDGSRMITAAEAARWINNLPDA